MIPLKFSLYPAYKPSDVEWLGEVPAHWAVSMVKQNYTIQLGKMLQPRPNTPQDVEIPYLKAQHVQWFHVRTTDVPKMWAGQSDIVRFGVAPSDLLVCEGGEGGRCGILRQDVKGYIIQNALHRVRPRQQSRNDYLQYVMSSVAATGWFDALNDKATIAHFTREKFGALRVPIPPLPEQAAIVRYLDHADARIRRYISAKERLIGLLEEQRQAVIHRAVTRGLNPNVRLKPSGVEWLGDVPAHWERRAVWQLFQIGRGKVISHEYIANHPGPFPLYSSQTENDGVMGHIDTFMFEGDFLTWTTDGAHAGTVFRRSGKFNCTNVCGTLFPKTRLNLDFMRMAVASETKRQVRLDINPKLMNNMMARIRVNVPPYDEQAQIVDYVERIAKPSDFGIERSRLQVNLLSEYRTRLIADVVTGKLDVREAAAALPEVDPLAAEDYLDETFATANESEFDSEDEAVEAAD